MPPFPYKTQPFAPYQREALQRSALKPYFFLSMAPGTGKTWISINTMAALYLHGKIDAAVVIAPNGVHMAWAYEQLPEHMPDVVPWYAYVWLSDAERKLLQQRTRPVRELADDPSIFLIVCLNTEAITLPHAKRDIDYLLTTRRCIIIVDESGDFTKPSGKRTRQLMRWRAKAPYRRCLDGTPVGVSPFELYSPYRFLSPSILGYNTFQEMKDAHAEWDEFERGDNGRSFKVVAVRNGKKQWKNLEVLHERIAPHTFRITKEQALPFLPPKQYAKRYFSLTKEQRRLIDDLKQQDYAEMADGSTVSVTNMLTRYLRYQQIAAGYVPADVVYGEDTEPVRILPGPNPRLDTAVAEILSYQGAPTLVWTRFQFDIDVLRPRLHEAGLTVRTYDGRTYDADREAAKHEFQEGKVNVLLINARAGGRGLNLQRAQYEVFYNNYFGLRTREQAEDRGHRIGTTTPVLITDIIGHQSIDVKIVKALRENKSVADIITGDPAKDWI